MNGKGKPLGNRTSEANGIINIPANNNTNGELNNIMLINYNEACETGGSNVYLIVSGYFMETSYQSYLTIDSL